jgi:hypothetical protein
MRWSCGGDEHAGSKPVQFDEKADDPRPDLWVDVARGLIRQQQFRFRDDRPRDRHALLLSARKRRRLCIEPVAKPHPLQQFLDLGPVRLSCSPVTRRGSDTFSKTDRCSRSRNSWKHDPDPPPRAGSSSRRRAGDVPAKHGN